MSTPPTGESRLASLASWAVLVASFGLSASTWVALAVLAGFTGHLTLLGASLALAWLMPVAVDGYVVVALTLWMAPVPARVAQFARANTYVAASIGVAAQSAYHALTIWTLTGVAWRAVMAALVGALPPAVAGLAVHMRALVRRESAVRSTVVEREQEPRPLPPVVQEAPQVSASIDPEPLPAALPEPEPTPAAPARPRKTVPPTAPRRPFAVTQQAAASMEAGGMEVPAIALALGISERQVRNALRPVPVDAQGGAS